MEKNNYNREQFIYTIDTSLTTEICEEIIMRFKNNGHNNILYSNFLSKDWESIKKCLKNQLLIQIPKYLNAINLFFENANNNNFTTLPLYNILLSLDRLQFVIKSSSSSQISDQTIVCQKIQNTAINIFKYMWFLNDYDGEIIFWREYSIRPKAGMLIIFPISWCFPYEELFTTSGTKYYITGEINITNKAFFEKV